MPEPSNNPTQIDNFDLARTPLRGVNLIDASAGTGKTYTICGLVIRLLLEKGLTIEQVLVVTYTEAATEDLRTRVRTILRQALEVLKTGKSDNEFLQSYLGSLQDKSMAEKRLSDALRSFDEAQIYTIHGFCQRTLLENSFESNTLFDAELIPDDSLLVQEVIRDFLRKSFYRSSSLFTGYARDRLAPEILQSLISKFIPRPLLKFIPAVDPDEGCTFSETEAEYIRTYKNVCNAWKSGRDEVAADLTGSQILNRNIYRLKSIPGLLASMDSMAETTEPSLDLFNNFDRMTSSRIIGATRRGHTPNILPFHELCENLVQLRTTLAVQYDRCILAMKKRLADSFHDELRKKKDEENVFSFDDLLRRLHRALSGPGGPAFASRIGAKYPAILIDEFQDTDPLQFQIFRAIHRASSLLFLIGDPKQAIYSFRGADIFTYMDAASSSPLVHHTLGVNYRSSPGLVRAVNTLFSRVRNPFFFEDIPFQPVDTPGCQDREQLTFDGADAPPFILWYLDGKNEGVPLSEHHHAALPKSEARETITAAVCSEIARLLSMAAADKVLINGRRLLPGDIAILVRKNSEAKKMQQALTQLEIPSVLHSGEDLFSSHEAREMSLFLGAAAAPNSIRKVKTALCTSLADLGQNLGTAAENGESMEQWLIRFRTYHAIWERYGFIQMFWSAMAENRVRQRILGLENGERILTNFFHLAEVLHQEAAGRGLSMTSLLGYLHERMSADLPRSTEHQLRLESDADRIKIVTIHKAKGLEYPVVFCPFSWEGARLESKKECLFHHRKEPGEFSELIFDGGSPELQTHLQQALQEEMAENLRLLYVALTRAVHRCYLVWGPFKSAATSGLAYLLHQGHAEGCNPKESAPIIKGADRFRQLSDQDIMADLNELASEAQGTIMIAQPPTVPETFLIQQEHDFNELESRRFTGTITNDWKISSFSSLTANRPFHGRVPEDAEEEYPGLDEVQSELEPGEIYSDQEPGGDFNIFNFPHGPGPGTMLHRLLEQIDFSRVNQEETDRLITDTLLGHGYDPAWLNALSEMLGDLAGVQLHRDIPGLSLGSVAASSCLHEVEFYFPISRITPDSLKSILGRSRKSTGGKGLKNGAAEQLGKLTFAPAKGFMKGFIDLVYRFEDKYYLLDWKSNHLGTRLQDYHRDTLAKVMLSDYYFLQCNLYCFALHLYLQRRLPSYSYEKNFGGAFYVFLRGVKQKQGPDFGIYHHVPEVSLMENFTEKLLGSDTVTDQWKTMA